MKTIQLLFILALSFTFIQCQKEEAEIIDQTQSPDAIVVGSPLAGLLSRTSQYPTSNDNVLDNSSCFSVQLPVTVIVNGNTITVTSSSDYQLVQNAIDAFASDDDIVNFVYPITIQYQNFSTQVLTNSNQLDDVLDDCGDDDGFDEIDCILINYPIVINVYNTSNQVTNTITVQSNTQLFAFIANLTPGTLAAIVYPISVTDSNGNNVVITSNAQLVTFIEDSIDDCDDNSGGPTPLTFNQIITSGTWYVSYFNEDGVTQTSDYNGYNFTFLNNNTITVVKNSTTTSGTWNYYLDSGNYKLNLTFTNSSLGNLDEDWRILEYTSTVIRLKHISGGNGGIDYLNFTKN
jgi:hypothetical protein